MKRSLEAVSGNQNEAEKRQKTGPREEERVVVDPMDPPVPGGRGPPRSCRWKGLEAPFHDGGCQRIERGWKARSG